VVPRDHEQPIERDVQRRARVPQECERVRIVGGLAPISEVAGEHDQIERHTILAEIEEVVRPALAQDAPPGGCL